MGVRGQEPGSSAAAPLDFDDDDVYLDFVFYEAFLVYYTDPLSDAPERSHTLPVGIPSATDRAVSFPLTDDQGPVSRVHAPQAARPVPRCRVQGDR